MLVNSKELFLKAKENKYAIPGVNIWNLNSLRGVLKAANENKTPLLVSLAEVHMDALSIEEAVHLVKFYAEKSEVPIVLHFDHGFSKDKVKKAIEMGFTSVMIDGSSLPFDENVKLTREIVEIAHKKNVCVEAEIGHVGGGESYIDADKDKGNLTDPEEALKFVEMTGVDSLAVSIGTAHGEYKGVPKIDFERLDEIAKVVDIPLVLHGGSGSGDENITKAVEKGICKVNIFTDLTVAAREALKEDFANRSYYDSCNLSEEAIKNCLLHYYNVLKTSKYNNK